MATDPKKILAMSDEELMFWTLAGEGGSSDHMLGETALNMRVAMKTLEANRELTKVTQELTNQTKALVTATQAVVKATWGVVLITLLTQAAALIYLVMAHK